MRENKALPVKPEMEEVHERLDAWRRAKKYASSPIPASLWDAAVELAKVHSIHEVSRSLLDSTGFCVYLLQPRGEAATCMFWSQLEWY